MSYGVTWSIPRKKENQTKQVHKWPPFQKLILKSSGHILIKIQNNAFINSIQICVEMHAKQDSIPHQGIGMTLLIFLYFLSSTHMWACNARNAFIMNKRSFLFSALLTALSYKTMMKIIQKKPKRHHLISLKNIAKYKWLSQNKQSMCITYSMFCFSPNSCIYFAPSLWTVQTFFYSFHVSTCTKTWKFF